MGPNRFELGTVDSGDGGCIRQDTADMSTIADRRQRSVAWYWAVL